MDSLVQELLWKVGPASAIVMSLFAVSTMYAKARHPRTPIGRYVSGDLCLFYQVWVHFISNGVFLAFSIPQIYAILSCNVRKWLLFYTAAMTFFSQYPSVLDCAIRTNDTPFYEQFHSQSPYTHLLMIVLCTWVPLISTLTLKQNYPENPLDARICDSVSSESITFTHAAIRAVFLALIVMSYVYMIVIIIYRNRSVPNSVIKHFNRILLARIFVLCTMLIVKAIVINSSKTGATWENVEFLFGLLCCFNTVGDVIAALLLPPMRPSTIHILTRFRTVTGS